MQCLLSKPEDLSLDPQQSGKKLGVVSSSLMGVEWGGGWGDLGRDPWPGSLIEIQNSGSVVNCASEIKVERNRDGNANISPWLLYVFLQANANEYYIQYPVPP